MRASNLSLFLSLALVSLLIFGLDSFQILKIPKQLVGYITSPIQYGFYRNWQKISQQFYFLAASRLAAQEYKASQEQIGQLLSENANLRRKLAETEARFQQEQSIDPRTYHLVAARPIGLDRYLKIDKGSVDGVKMGQAAIFKDNFIGQVINVSEKGASLKLPSDPDSKLAAFSIGKEGRAKGVLIGQFGAEMIFDKILHEEPLAEGDLVYSEGTEGFLPRGLILGKVIQIVENQTQVFKQAKVGSVFDIRDLELVFLITE